MANTEMQKNGRGHKDGDGNSPPEEGIRVSLGRVTFWFIKKKQELNKVKNTG